MAEEAEKAARTATRAAMLALIAVSVAAVIVVIDHGIKRAIIEEAQKAKTLLERIESAKEAGNARAETETDRNYPGTDFNGSGGVSDASAAGEAVDQNNVLPENSRNSHPARVANRPERHE